MSFSASPSCRSDLKSNLGLLLNRKPGFTLSLECEMYGWAGKMFLWCVDPHSVSGVDNDLLHVQPDFMRVQGRVPVWQLVISKPEHDVLRPPPVTIWSWGHNYYVESSEQLTPGHSAPRWWPPGAHKRAGWRRSQEILRQCSSSSWTPAFWNNTIISLIAFWRFPAMVSRFHGPQPHPRSLWCSCCFRPAHHSCLHLSGNCWNKSKYKYLVPFSRDISTYV